MNNFAGNDLPQPFATPSQQADPPESNLPETLYLQETERLSAIIATQQIIATSALDHDALMTLIVERAQAITQANGAAFEFHEGEEMVYRACCGSVAAFQGLSLSVHASLSGQCVLSGQILRCDDSETDTRVDREACRRIGARSMIVVPLPAGEAIIGVLKVLSAQPCFFTERDVQTLQLMAGLFGAVINQAAVLDAQKEALRQSERQHQTFFETTTQGIVYLDKKGVITVANPVAAQLLNVEPHRLVGQSLTEVQGEAVHEDGSPCLAQDLPEMRALRTGEIVRGQVIGVRHHENAPIRWMRVDSIPQFDSVATEPQEVYSLFTDITGDKQAQIQRDRNQREIEALNVSLQRTLTETHHRVKNSLQVLLAMIDLDLMEQTENIPRERFKHLSGNVRALALVHDILTQQTRADWQNRLLSTRPLLRKLLALLQNTLPVQLQSADIADIPLSLERGTALALLIHELVQNAIKQGGKTINVAVKEADGQTQISVCDDGPGFPRDFDPFLTEGTGLEMAMTLARHDLNGIIAFQNREEGGACVSVSFISESYRSSFF